jgi:hypothetical protein
MLFDYLVGPHGTMTLFAALNVLDGTVISACMQKHRQDGF